MGRSMASCLKLAEWQINFARLPRLKQQRQVIQMIQLSVHQEPQDYMQCARDYKVPFVAISEMEDRKNTGLPPKFLDPFALILDHFVCKNELNTIKRTFPNTMNDEEYPNGREDAIRARPTIMKAYPIKVLIYPFHIPDYKWMTMYEKYRIHIDPIHHEDELYVKPPPEVYAREEKDQDETKKIKVERKQCKKHVAY
jgi:hypothetical protein